MSEETRKDAMKINDNKKLFIGAFLMAVLGIASIMYGLQFLACIAITITDIYLFLILLFAAIRSDCKANKTTYNTECIERIGRIFPSRTNGVLVFGLLLISLTTSFAGLYVEADISPNFVGTLDPIYFSFVTITTLGSNEVCLNDGGAKILVIWQLVSGILLFFGVFPLLISRVSTF